MDLGESELLSLLLALKIVLYPLCAKQSSALWKAPLDPRLNDAL